MHVRITELSTVTKPNRYPVPYIQHITAIAQYDKYLSNFDLIHAYHQIPGEQTHILKTIIVIAFGLKEFIWVPFGLHNES